MNGAVIGLLKKKYSNGQCRNWNYPSCSTCHSNLQLAENYLLVGLEFTQRIHRETENNDNLINTSLYVMCQNNKILLCCSVVGVCI